MKVLEQDAGAYLYDEVYDDIDTKRRMKDPRLAAKEPGQAKPKYIKNLLATADKRKLDEELRSKPKPTPKQKKKKKKKKKKKNGGGE